MSTSRPGSDRDSRFRRVTRDELALALDGALPPTFPGIDAGYRAAMAPLAEAMPQPLETLRRLAAAGRVYATSRFDNLHRFLDVAGVPVASSCSVNDGDEWPGVVFVGCLGRATAGDNRWIEWMLSRGAIIVTSDLTAGLPVLAEHLNFLARRPATRARVAIGPDLAEMLVPGSGWSRLLRDLRPAVRLAPGHPPMDVDQPIGTRIIASNALTGEPLVALADVAGGQVLHSVAHWWQETQPDSTELGQRPLSAIPALADYGVEHPAAHLSGFGAASVLLAALFAGLDAAFARIAPHDWPDCVLPLVGQE